MYISAQKSHVSNHPSHGVVLERVKICFARNCLKSPDLHRKILVLNPTPFGWGSNAELFFARNLMKCANLHITIMFLTPPSLWGRGVRDMIFLHISGCFMQFITNKTLGP